MSYKEATLYFMSGTGNSFRAAAWMGAAARKWGAADRVIPLVKGNPAAQTGNGNESLIGLVFPVHGFTAPWPVIRFALQLPRSRGTHALVVATRGGTKIGPVFLPGMEGTAVYLIALILVLKGYRVRGVMGLNMPSNWMTLHWGLSPENVQAILSRSNVKAVGYMERIFAGECCFGGWAELLLGLILLPISLGYLALGRFYLAKLLYASANCTGCGLCVASCPFGGVKMREGKLRRPYWTFHCESCMRCMGFCPAKAVEASHPLAVVLYGIIVLPAPACLMQWLSKSLSPLAGLNTGWMMLWFSYLYALASIYLGYRLFSILLRHKTVNRLFTCITLTHYYRRYHEPNTTTGMMQEG